MDFTAILAKAIRTAEQRQAHAVRVAEYNAALKRDADKQYDVIEVATGKALGDPMPRMFAEYVRDVRDTFQNGEFVIQEVSTHRAKAA